MPVVSKDKPKKTKPTVPNHAPKQFDVTNFVVEREDTPTPTDSSVLVRLKSVRFVSAPKDSGLSSLVKDSESVKLYADGDWTVVVTAGKTLQISPSQVVYRELA